MTRNDYWRLDTILEKIANLKAKTQDARLRASLELAERRLLAEDDAWRKIYRGTP